jgi:predicted amidophosphoribosyltransferase
MSSAVRQMPCPDCGSPVRPDIEQLCASCGYPLMFLRRPVEDDARAVPRSPNEREDPTGMTQLGPPRQRVGDTRQFPATTYGHQAAPAGHGQTQCPRCGYGNEPARIRCERCGHELRQARPDAVRLAPPVPQAPARRTGMVWLIVLIVLAVLSLLLLAGTLLWTYLR